MSELYDILTETPPTKVVLLALDQGLWDCERSLAELSALCEANHMEAVAQISQKRQTPETGIVLGSGKLEEASLAAQELGLGAVWLGTWPQMDRVEAQQKLFGLPETIVPHSIIALGYPEADLTAPRESRYEDDRVHFNQW